MPKAVRKASSPKPAPSAGVVIVQSSPLVLAMGMWQKRLNVISGSMVLTYKHNGPTPEELRTWHKELTLVATQMEKHL